MKKLTQYIKDGFSLRPAPNDTWMVYTPSTGNFVIESLDELTPDRFDKAIVVFKNSVTQGVHWLVCIQTLPKKHLRLLNMKTW